MKRFFLHLMSLVFCLVPTVAFAHTGDGVHLHVSEMHTAVGFMLAVALFFGVLVLAWTINRILGKTS